MSPLRAAILPLTGLVMVALLAPSSPAAEIPAKAEPPDLTALPLEALMEIEVPKVYGASKFEQLSTEAPASVSVVTCEEIKRYGYRTLADVLRSVQGFYVSYDRSDAFLGTRGISLGDFNSRILLLVDGHRVNNDLTDGAFLGTDFILDIDLIDRVEVIRGPGSVLYGNNAFFGVVNVITRQGQNLNGAEVSGEYGSFDTFKGRVTYGKLFTNGVQLLLSGTLYDSAGPDELFYPEFNTPDQNNGIAQGLDDDRYGSVFGSVGYGDFRLQGGYINREKGNPTAQYYTTFNDSRLHTSFERGYVDLKYGHEFPEVVDVTARLYYDWNKYEIGYPFAPLFFEEEQAGEWGGTEVQLDKRLWERHVVTLGAEYRDDFRQDLEVYDHDTGQIYTDVNRDQQTYGVFLQGDFAVRTNLHFNGGVRYDKYEEFDGEFNPRLALIYHPFPKSTLKAIYGTAFRAPNFLELSDSRFQDIRPEKIRSYEIVYEQEIGWNLRSSVSGFYNQMSDLIVFAFGSFTNFDARAKGVELALEGLWASGIRGRASYTLQDTANEWVGWDLPDSPNHLFKFNVSVPLLKEKIFAGLEFQYTSERLSLHNITTVSGQPITVQGEQVNGFGVLNFTLFSRNLVKNLEFSASLYNLLDCHYGDPATRFHRQDIIEQDGRSFRLKLTYRF